MSNPREPDVHLRAQDDLASLALGEPVGMDVIEHVAGCAACQEELAAYRRVVDLASVDERVLGVDETPPPEVWERIAAATAAPPAAPAAAVVRLESRRARRRGWLVAAAIEAADGAWARSCSPSPA